MGKITDIAWCDHTFNPWHGCMRVSPGCTNCYMFTLMARMGKTEFLGPSKTTQRRHFGGKHWAEPLDYWDKQAYAEGRRHRVFCASMADVFEDNPDIVMDRMQLWALIGSTPNLDWLLLTKRPENVMRMVPSGWQERFPPNVWIGTSVESQEYAALRIPVLWQIPAIVRFISVEPMLGPVNLGEWIGGWPNATYATYQSALPLHWVICGGESGPRHRPFDLQWARDLRDQCEAAGVAYFFKQVGGFTHAAGGDRLDGREHKDFPQNGLREVVKR